MKTATLKSPVTFTSNTGHMITFEAGKTVRVISEVRHGAIDFATITDGDEVTSVQAFRLDPIPTEAKPKYTLEGIRGYYYLVNHETGRQQNTGYDTTDWPWQADGSAHEMLLNKYRRALALQF